MKTKRIKTENQGKKSNQASQIRPKDRLFYFLSCSFCFSLLLLFSGCGNKFFDPTQIGRFRPVPAVNVILDTLGVAEEEPEPWEGAEEPLPSDIVAVENDYIIRNGDILRVSIFELLQEGYPFVNDYIVNETGRISIPEVGVIEAAGLTETQLEEQIRQILSPSILKNPSVTVTLLSSQHRTFSILGDGVPAPGRYVIPRYDFRLTDALATAGGPAQFNVSYIYVSRRLTEKPTAAEPGELELIEPEITEPGQLELQLTEPEMVEPNTTEPLLPEEAVKPEGKIQEVITPRAQYNWPASKVVIASTELATSRELAEVALPNGFGPSPVQKPNLKLQQQIPKASPQLVDPETIEEPVDVQDILETLRARREKINEQKNIEELLKSFGEPPVPERVEQELTDIEQELKSPATPAPAATKIEDVNVPELPKLPTPTTPTAPETTIMKEPIEEEEAGHIEWIFQDGKWVPVQVGPPEPTIEPQEIVEILPEEVTKPPVEEVPPPGEWPEKAKMRVIKIPADKLLAGDPRYNIVIKPGDAIHVPVDIIGEFYIMGNTNYQGTINLTGRPMTLKMAIAAAGGLGPLAWPKKCEVIRRIGRDKEEIVMVDLDEIASGEVPDFFIKPNDLINVGTHATSRWRAILRNAFRATYGFGFIYDRNFADADFGKGFRMPHWF